MSHVLFNSLVRLVSQWQNLGFPVYHFFSWKFEAGDLSSLPLKTNSINSFVACILVYIYHFEIVNVTDRSDTLREANEVTSV